MRNMETLQFVCCVATLVLALMLALSRLQVRWTNRRYEQSRWILCIAMSTFAAHYYVQMAFGLRDLGDEVGAVANILVYTPAAFAISYAILNVAEAEQGLLRRHLWVSAAAYALILGCFALGGTGGQHLLGKGMLYAMLALFVLGMAYAIAVTRRGLRRWRKQLEKQSGGDLQPYVKYMQSGVTLLYAIAAALPLVIPSSALLVYVGPVMLLAVVFFVQSFMALGYFYEPLDDGVDEVSPAGDGVAVRRADRNGDDGKEPDRKDSPDWLTEERIAQVEAALGEWCEAGGFRNSEANMTLLALQLNIDKWVLTRFFDQHLNTSFRSWLSNIRFKEVQRMMIEFPQYSNDAISFECGFSSHAHLYKIFKEKTGLTPRQWKEQAARPSLGQDNGPSA